MRRSAWVRAIGPVIAAGIAVPPHSGAHAGDGVACGRCTSLLAISAIEEVPEHAFGWTFGDPQPFCQLGPDSRLRVDSLLKTYRGGTFRKVHVVAGPCAGHAGWILQGETPAVHTPMRPGTDLGK